MPRVYIRGQPGTRTYKNYTDENLTMAKKNVQEGKMSLYKASHTYKIPLGTLHNKVHGKHLKKLGGQTAFTETEELALVESILIASDWGYGLNALDFRFYTKAYLDRTKKHVPQFKNNFPGEDWALSILSRYKDLISSRISTNIKPARAQVGPQELTSYHTNLGELLADVPPSNIVNYDETNMSDDPGRMKVLCRKRVKYVEKVIHHSKSCTTVMFSAAADGTLLPPYVIYKAGHLWNSWVDHGPVGAPCCTDRCCKKGARYNCTTHGWMDLTSFKDWLRTIVVPHRRRKPGKFVIIGDNFSAHLDEEVLQICKENDIIITCLPPNSTHLTQPLDVAFFRALKEAWRFTLRQWRQQNSRIKGGLPKELFAGLLTTALERMTGEKIKNNIISAFRATGIVPHDLQALLKRLPGYEDPNQVQSEASTTLINFYKEQRFIDKPPPQKRRRTRLNVVPGKSVAATQDTETESSSCESNDDSDSSDSNDDDEGDDADETEAETPADEAHHAEEIPPLALIPSGSYLLAKFQGESVRRPQWFKYVCVVESITTNGLQVMGFQSLRGSKTVFEPKERDISVIRHCEILAVLPQPTLVKNGSRFHYKFIDPIDIKEV